MICFIVLMMMLYFQKVKGGCVTCSLCVIFTHTACLFSLFSLDFLPMSPNAMSCVESCVCVACRLLGERRDDSVSLCACVCLLFLLSHLRSLLSILGLFALSSFRLSVSTLLLFSIELPLVHSLVVIVVKKEGKRNKRNLLCHKNVHLQCSLCLCVSFSRINR